MCFTLKTITVIIMFFDGKNMESNIYIYIFIFINVSQSSTTTAAVIAL